MEKENEFIRPSSSKLENYSISDTTQLNAYNTTN